MVAWTKVAGSSAVGALGLEFVVLEEIPSARIHVRFRRGRTYVYAVGNSAYYDSFLSAPSKGRFYVHVIKARFDYVAKY